MVISLFKKKRELPIPPPPTRKPSVAGDLPDISFNNSQPEFPLIPDMPDIRPAKIEDITPKQKRIVIPPKKETVIKKDFKPVFVSVDDYRKINDYLNRIMSRLKEAGESAKKLESIKLEHESAVNSWMQSLEDVEKKISKIDEVISRHSEIS